MYVLNNMEYVCSEMIVEFTVNDRIVLSQNTNINFHLVFSSNSHGILMT